MSGWVSQRQVRNRAHGMVRVDDRHFWESDEEIGIFISALIGSGYTVDRSDAISVTLRSPATDDGSYSFVHCWREG
jgi:hypothetical protein